MKPDSEVWASLDTEASSGSTTGGGLVRQRVRLKSRVPLFFAVDPRGHGRSLLIEMPADWELKPADLPRWKGMKAEVQISHPGGAPQRILHMRHLVPAHAEVFEAVVADVSDKIADGSGTSDAFEQLVAALEGWKSFFKSYGFDGLSREGQQGLYAELRVMRQLLIPAAGPSVAVESWTGPERATHDFQLKAGSIEVKSTRGSKPERVRIANEKQLDDAGLSALVLAVVLMKVRKEGGETLPQIVESLRSEFAAAAGGKFEDRLLRYGYLDAHSALYLSAYHVDAIRGYQVVDGFPRLLSSGLPDGVGDISYSVVVSACSKFEIDLEEVVGSMASEASHG